MSAALSPAEQFRALPAPERARRLHKLTVQERAALLYTWPFWARPDQLPPPGEWSTWVARAGRGWGKALALDTPLPTPTGWTTMGAVREAEHLFDERGQLCRVIGKSPVQHDRVCYRVAFSDGAEIVADAEHLWRVQTKAFRKSLGRRRDAPAQQDRPQCVARTDYLLMTTQQMRAALTVVRQDARIELNLAIETAAPLALPPADLPVDPYVLGLWLGDGTSATAELTLHSSDAELLGYIEAAGYPLGAPRAKGEIWRVGIGVVEARRCATTGRMIANGSLHSALRSLGLLGNKHIPAPYLRGSVAQRLALVQGLMDSDGHITPLGHCEFTTTNRPLADGMFELLVSLGLKPTVCEGRATLCGVDCGPKYRVKFTPYDDTPVFRLRRKAERVKPAGRQAARQRRRYVTAIEPVASRPVQCIAVDSPSRLYLAGRQMIPTHNTRTGAEWIRARIAAGARRVALVGDTAADVRDVMVEGPSGVLAVAPPWERPHYEPSKRRLTWANGAQATTYSADDPEQLRGPEHDTAWADELGKWRYADAWDQLQFGLRVGADPRALVTTTPRPVAILRRLLAEPGTVETRGSTYDNRANLPDAFFQRVIERYEGTRLGRQEIHAELLTDTPGALWTAALLERNRVAHAPPMVRVVIGVDPAAGPGETGIIVAGLDADGTAFVLADATVEGPPATWAAAVAAAYDCHAADRVVAEINQGGTMVTTVLRAARAQLPITTVRATRGKYARAEPVSALYERGRVRHVGLFPLLEDQLTTFVPGGPSPDRLDALVWALTHLMLAGTGGYAAASGQAAADRPALPTRLGGYAAR